MRYPDGGGLSAAGRARREKVRLRAAERFAEGVTPPEVARRLRVSCNSAYARHRARTAPDGSLIPMAEQDRSLWDRGAIDVGVSLVTAALPRGPIGP
jgi:predicted RNA polymerase sigma factor